MTSFSQMAKIKILSKMRVHFVWLLAISLTVNSYEVSSYPELKVQCLAHYHNSSSRSYLTAITTNLTLDDSKSSYNIIYSDAVSGNICHQSKDISYTGKPYYISEYVLNEPICPSGSDINVTVVSSANTPITIPVTIDGSNKFVSISFNKTAGEPSITCTFIDQPRKTKKFCRVKYGHCIPGSNLSSHVEGHILNSNSISLGWHDLTDTSELCFIVEASNGTVTVNVTGRHVIVSADALPHVIIYYIFLLLVVVAGSIILSVIWVTCYTRSKMHNGTDTGEINYDLHMSVNDVGGEWKPIDLSTTYFMPLKATKKQKLFELFVEKIEQYDHEDGHGFRRLTKEELPINASKKIIVMDQQNEKPKSIASAIDLQKKFPETHVYVRTRNYSRKVGPGADALYCALSDVVIAYQKVYRVPNLCKESDFVAKVIPGYQKDWIRFGYFQLTHEEDIKPYQQVVVQKKSNELMMGSGVRHLLGAISKGSSKIRPPMKMHKEWNCIFVQSNGDDDRQLQSGTTYLFCALMEKVNAYCTVCDVKTECNMEKFGRQHIPGFTPEMGYGYYEFKEEDEHYKPYKRVIVIHKNKKMYTGAGAKFLCIEGQYSDKVKSRESKISPPNLAGTDWLHIFVQSYSRKRVLLPGTKFLYCEYK